MLVTLVTMIIKSKNPHPEDPGDYDASWGYLYAPGPVVLRKQIIGYHHGQQTLQHSEEGREHTRQELQSRRVGFQQKDMTDVDL